MIDISHLECFLHVLKRLDIHLRASIIPKSPPLYLYTVVQEVPLPIALNSILSTSNGRQYAHELLQVQLSVKEARGTERK